MLNQTDLNSMRGTQLDSLMDTCIIRRKGLSAEDTFGDQAPTYTDDLSTTAFGLKYLKVSEVNSSDQSIVQADAEGRFTLTTTLGIEDQIKVTKRFGETLTTPVYFQIVGVPRRGPSGLVVLLKEMRF